jgi:DNA-binding NarL/FixJ family response regulator
MTGLRVLLADDQQMLAEALKSVLEPRCEVVDTVSDGRRSWKLRPDCGLTSLCWTLPCRN